MRGEAVKKVRMYRVWGVTQTWKCETVVLGQSEWDLKALTVEEKASKKTTAVLFATCTCPFYSEHGHWDEAEGEFYSTEYPNGRWCEHIRKAVPWYKEDTGFVSSEYWVAWAEEEAYREENERARKVS